MLGDTLKELRDAKNATQEDMAKLLHLKRQTYSAYERNLSLPDSETITRLSRYFNVSADYLLGIRCDPTPVREKTLEESLNETEELSEESKADLQKYMDLLKRRDRDRLFEASHKFNVKPVES